MKGLDSVLRGRDVLVASLAILLWLFAGLSAFAGEPPYYVEYMESSGTQGIVLPVTNQLDLTFDAKVRWMQTQNTGCKLLACWDYSDETAPILYMPFGLRFVASGCDGQNLRLPFRGQRRRAVGSSL